MAHEYYWLRGGAVFVESSREAGRNQKNELFATKISKGSSQVGVKSKYRARAKPAPFLSEQKLPNNQARVKLSLFANIIPGEALESEIRPGKLSSIEAEGQEILARKRR